MTPRFEHLVVGKGMIGAAALCHLSEAAGEAGAVGPDEPPDRGTHRGVYSSHYDQGRIVSQLSRDPTWARLVAASIAQYASLEAAGGLRSYRPVGLLHMAPAGDPCLRKVARLARSEGVRRIRLAGDALTERLPLLRMPPGFEAELEEGPAGVINPRSFVANHLAIAERNGAAVIRETVVAVDKAPTHWCLTTDQGRNLTARNVLLSVGAYTNCFDLVPRQLDLRVKSETVVLLEVPLREAHRLRDLPAISYRIESPSISDIYIVPPLLFPDGRYYLKLGANTDSDSILPDLEAIQQWMMAGRDEARRDMREAVFDLIPDLDVVSARAKRCLVTYSAHGLPYVDRLDEGLFVATAGNGAAAACSDTLGWLAAQLMLDRPWPANFQRRAFERRFAGAAIPDRDARDRNGRR